MSQFQRLGWKKKKANHLIKIFILITCGNDTILNILSSIKCITNIYLFLFTFLMWQPSRILKLHISIGQLWSRCSPRAPYWGFGCPDNPLSSEISAQLCGWAFCTSGIFLEGVWRKGTAEQNYCCHLDVGLVVAAEVWSLEMGLSALVAFLWKWEL